MQNFHFSHLLYRSLNQGRGDVDIDCAVLIASMYGSSVILKNVGIRPPIPPLGDDDQVPEMAVHAWPV
jgi:hypothetical protein